MYLKVFTVAAILVILLSGCVEPGSKLKPNADDSMATVEGLNETVQGNNQFALDVYNKFTEEEGNVFFSPWSISTALAMTYEGARGKTAEEMQSVLQFPADGEVRMPSFARLYNILNTGEKPYKLHTANALWAQKDYKFLPEYTDAVEKYYVGKVTNLDFKENTENSRLTINNWVEEQTNDKIKDLIPQGVINQLTRLVLTNAIYFKGSWALQFDEEDTKEEDFKLDNGGTVKAKMMRQFGEEFNYAETDELQILEMPYKGDELSMIVLLPKEGFQENLERLDAEKLQELRESLVNKEVEVYIPKFKFETKYFMVETLKEMGMPTAFTEAADFSGIDGTGDLAISNVIHQAFVEVNEEGTEAAAATAVVVGITSIDPKEIPEFRADHPFTFVIQERKTGSILFLGKVANPSE